MQRKKNTRTCPTALPKSGKQDYYHRIPRHIQRKHRTTKRDRNRNHHHRGRGERKTNNNNNNKNNNKKGNPFNQHCLLPWEWATRLNRAYAKLLLVLIMDSMASHITSLTIVYSAVYSGADQRKNQSSASLTFVWGIHRGPVNSPHKGPVTRKMFPLDDVIMRTHLLVPLTSIRGRRFEC